ncbi:MAG: ParA family partition ATPase [Acidobacteriota bacterium]
MAEAPTPVLAVANTKGGVGKSTLATNLAAEAARAGESVLLVDTDPQASATLFAATRGEDRPGFRVVQMTKPILHREVPALAAPFDLAVIDTGGRETATFRSALASAHRVLVPITPSAYDIWASEDVFSMLDELMTTRTDLAASVVLNQVIPRTRIAQDALDALEELAEEQGIGLLETRLHGRVAWKMAASRGLSVAEHEPRGAAAAELRALCAELGLFDPED